MAKQGSKPDDTRGHYGHAQDTSRQTGIPVGHFVPDGSIEAMEAEGQRQFVNGDSIPVRIQGNKAEVEALLTHWGFELGSQHKQDELFRWAMLPNGWKREATDHSMWSKIVDDQGRERISIFYKAAFYDRDAFMRLTPRYSTDYRNDVSTEPLDGVGYDIIKCKDRDDDKRVKAMVVVDRKSGATLIAFVGSDYGDIGDKAGKFLVDKFGDDYSNPKHWDSP